MAGASVAGALQPFFLLIPALVRGAIGCSFFGTGVSWDGSNFEDVNKFTRPRGPDGTKCVKVKGYTICHNLLHMTGDMVKQPFVDSDNNIVALYNGEVYNYEALAQQLGMTWVRSDGEVILPMYKQYGETFARHLDGEFAVVVLDFNGGFALLFTDTFSTKPLWFSRSGGALRFASYRSAVLALGAKEEDVQMVDPNTMLLLGLTALEPGGVVPVLGKAAVVEFDTRQFKTDVNDFLQAFYEAVAKRMRSIHPVFIGLSAGYDSGAIQVALKLLGKAHATYTIYSTEDMKTIEGRLQWAGDLAEGNIVVLSEEDRAHEEQFLRENCEFFLFSGLGRQGSLFDDPASHGVSYIFREVRKRGYLVYLSGTGADEILSDYGFGGKKFFPHSSFGGLFPEDLQEIFPWPSFFIGTQRDYLMKEELVSGAHGVEGRYPFLDRRVVQEYLWLDASLKNSQYKAPLHVLLESENYPFIKGEKVGFNADWNVKDGGSSIVMRKDSPQVPKIAQRFKPSKGPQPSTPSPASTTEEDLSQFKAQLVEYQRKLEERRVNLLDQEEKMTSDINNFDEERMQRIQSYLFYMLPRLLQMQHSAASVKPRPPPALPGDSPVHPRWQDVEVVTCVSGGTHLVVADFPVYDIFRGTTPLRVVHNLCENNEWEGMHFRLRAYANFFAKLPETEPGQQPTLYIVSDGADVFFNDLSEVTGVTGDNEGSVEAAAQARAKATAKLIAERYERVASSAGGPPRPIVASTERLCGWGGAKLCSKEEEARYPQAPTDSKYLNAGGYMGPRDALLMMITEVLALKERSFGEEAENAKTSDQYYFKRFFWEHQDLIALDYHQLIFGNFLEVVNEACESNWVPTCAMTPCCTESDNFRRFADLFYGRYEVRGCSVWRGDNLPVSWHGNGAGKWLWLLALDRLVLQCSPAANLTVARYPEKVLQGVYDRFEERSARFGEAWPGGFLLRSALSLAEAPTELPQSCLG